MKRHYSALFIAIAGLFFATTLKAQSLEDMASRIQALEQTVNMPERVSKQSVSSVALIVGEYIWTDRAGRRPLRYEGLDERGNPLQDEQGNELVTFTGNQQIVVREFSGTGFLLDNGKVLTSGFVLAPWADDPLLDQREDPEFHPSIRVLHAYFPNYAKGVQLKIDRAAESEDAVLCTIEGTARPSPGLALSTADGVRTGQQVLSIGYPGGVQLLVARLPQDAQRELFKNGYSSKDAIAKEMAARGLIQPLVLQGRVSAQHEGRIFYDMLSAYGSTGGPLLNARGEVIGVTESMMPQYPSFNQAQSVSNLRSWLTGFGNQD